jgi:hypothetical protein
MLIKQSTPKLEWNKTVTLLFLAIFELPAVGVSEVLPQLVDS